MTGKTDDTMARLRALHAGMPRNVSAAPAPKADARLTDFRTHPEYQKIAVAKGAGQMLSIESPFFRRTDAVDGTRVSIDGRWVESFSGYDYLSLNADPRLAEAVAEAVARYGVSARASRFVGGELDLHRQLDTELAAFLGTEDAVSTVSGHATNLAVIRTLMGRNDVVLVDSMAHNSVYEGLRASGADHMSVPHGDTGWLDDWLSKNRHRYERVLIVVEGLYSMDGDVADLPALVEIKDRHGAWLMLDEAHSIGVLGARGAGLAEECGVAPGRVDIVMGTLSKTFCSCGGFVAGSSTMVDIIRHAAPGFVYSVGLSVPNTAAALTALRILQAEPERVAQLRSRGALFHRLAGEAGLDRGLGQGYSVAPVIVADSIRATLVSNRLFADGVLAMPIIAPAVPDKQARLRFFLNAGHSDAAIAEAIEKTARHLAECGHVSF
ncbi:8-amino-7-oxononanoate synthase [Rhodovulum sp. P5]|uniref:aminotransferase class I/II-fold pyridoxal phosphate-dependent enzyme n=1 Tax=Rhodovulum sp. P5 TaxID=1564506 RepID=UPI0009C238AC|nr:aminotransferase class I/II-fold pyridoxal phosphate-dependent enzyme [Rhodovulum sp. P5]ARE39413.1 8-amino-7-oxononanoate synthase [Rhodovulum sp. P5]